jgi:L-methionine (R)-S-oxide reductase
MAMPDNSDKFRSLRKLASEGGSRVEMTRAAARLVRTLGSYRWVGLYDVSDIEIAVVAWDGPEPPTYPRFPISQGLNGAAVATKKSIIVQDVSVDPRYLATIGGTRGEMIQPVLSERGDVIGTIDVESDRVNAFSQPDHDLLAQCAIELRWLWKGET